MIVRPVKTAADHVSTQKTVKPVQITQNTSTLKTNASPAQLSRTAANSALTAPPAQPATPPNILTLPLTPPTTHANAPRLISPTTINVRHATMELTSV